MKRFEHYLFDTTALHFAAGLKEDSLLLEMLDLFPFKDVRKSNGDTLLHSACKKGATKNVEFLLSDIKCDPNNENQFGFKRNSSCKLHISCEQQYNSDQMRGGTDESLPTLIDIICNNCVLSYVITCVLCP
jgi:ankyrin repeat protein